MAFKYHLNQIAGKIGLGLIRFAARDSNMVRHAKDEWNFAFTEYDEMRALVGESIFNVVAVFSLEGHSGFSADYTIGFIEKALRFEPFSPLRGTDDEWTDIGGYSDVPAGTFFQNKRLSSVFKENGRCYDIDGGPVYMEPSGACFTKGGPFADITFPYEKPETREIIHVDEDGEPFGEFTPSPAEELAPVLRERATKLRNETNDQRTPGLLDAAAELLEKAR